MSTGNDSILDAFLYETNTLLEQLDSIVLTDEQENNFSEEDVNTIFRIMHTIKGSSAMMEYNSLMTIAHRAEDMFSIIREKTMDVVPEALRPNLFDLMFQVIDFFRQEISHIESGKPLNSDIDTLLGKVNSFISQIQNGMAAASGEADAETNDASDGSAELPYTLQIFFDEGCGMENLRAYMLVGAIRELCAEGDFTFEPEDVQTNSSSATKIIDNGFILRFKNRSDRDNAIHSVTGAGSVKSYQTMDTAPEAPAVEEAAPVASAPTPAPEEVKEPAPKAVEEPAPAPKQAPVAAPAVSKAPAQAAPAATGPHHRESLISVNLSKLDELAAVVGEIVITESMVTASPDLKGLKLDEFTKSARQLRKLTDQLQDVSMSLRMVPVSGTFQKMHRIVRDMSKKLNKPCKLTLVGEDTEVDKTIVDSIGDPIMHIVRNSMDHGIEENVEDRVAAGKDSTGEIILSARHTGSEVII